MREIGVLTTSRADFSIYTPILELMKRSRKLQARLLASGAHLDIRHGRTIREIEAAGYPVFRRIPCLRDDVSSSIAEMVRGMGKLLRNWRPDLLLVLGDRFEMFAGALAAVPFHIPIAHLHGGEITEGSFDDSFRHALSKLAHLHFVATREAADRLRRMGEEPWRITVSGAPGLDRFGKRAARAAANGGEFLLVTFHSVTRQPGTESGHAEALVRALRKLGRPCVVTAPNSDPGSHAIRDRLVRFCESDRRSRFVENAGADGYFDLMAGASAMVGNSSSGILEAASLRLPVVNIGVRQKGRLRGRNVIDCDPTPEEIVQAVRKAMSISFRRSLRGLRNPYGDGHASERIVRKLEAVRLDERLLMKRFYE